MLDVDRLARALWEDDDGSLGDVDAYRAEAVRLAAEYGPELDVDRLARELTVERLARALIPYDVDAGLIDWRTDLGDYGGLRSPREYAVAILERLNGGQA